MIFDYKKGMEKRENLLIEQNKLLDIFIDSIKQPFREWYQEVDRSKVDWLISQFLIDCGYGCKQEDFLLHFRIPTGIEEDNLNMVNAIVKQYGVEFVLGELSQKLSLDTLRGDKS